MPDRAAVLYVDDESGNRLVFEHSFGQEFRVLVASGGEEALRILDSGEDVAIVLTDQRMPRMSGNELLAEVKKKYPEVARAVVSAYEDFHAVAEALNRGLATRYVVKPWRRGEIEELLRWAVRSATERRQAGGRTSIDEILTKAHTIPETAVKLAQIADDDDSNADELEGVIEPDPTVRAGCLMVTNSVAFGAGAKVGRVRDAIDRLGSEEVTQISLAVSLAGDWLNASESRRQLWRHAVSSGLAAKVVAGGFGDQDPNRLYVCGLLHDAGRLLFLGAEGRAYVGSASAALPGLGVERDRYGFDHVDLGVAWATRSGLGTDVVESIQYHHETSSGAWLRSTTQAAGLAAIAHHCGSQVVAAEPTAAHDCFERATQILDWLGLGYEDVQRIVDGATKEYSKLLAALGIARRP